MTDKNNDITITTRDRVLRAWQNSVEMTRDFEMYSKLIEDERESTMFANFAVDEGLHAAKLLGLLHEYEASM